MPFKKDVSRTIKGMNRDFHPMMLEDGSYTDALNAIVEGFDGNGLPILGNEPSTVLCSDFPEGYKSLGFINIIEQNRIIWFLKNEITGDNEIGETLYSDDCRKTTTNGIIKGCDDCKSVKLSESTKWEDVKQSACCQYNTIDNQQCFNFDFNFPVNATQYRITECGIDIFFSDNNNSRRWLQLEYDGDNNDSFLVVKKTFKEIIGYNVPPCEDPVYGEHVDCNKMNVQPMVETPCIEFIDLVSGGSNKAGVYQFFIAFSDQYGNKRTSYLSSTNIIPIRTKDVTFDTDYSTDRAISLKIHNLDKYGAFEYYKVAVAKTINHFTSFYEVGLFPITQTKIVYTGNDETEIKLTEGDIFQRVPFYKTAKCITVSNNIMFNAGLKGFNRPNLQRVANKIKLYWQTIAIPEAAYRNPRNTNKFRSCLRDEVYPYGVVFIYNNTEESSVYHIPGREGISSDFEIINNNDVISDTGCDNVERNERWMVYNTGTIEGGDLSVYKECEETCYQYGEFAYWQSSQRYPNKPEIWGELCGEYIRHHKYPDSRITHIHNYENGSAVFKDNNIVFPIGVKVDHDSVVAAIADAVTNNIISQDDADRITGYRIVRGNRFRNKSVVAKGLLFDVNNYQRDTLDDEPVFFPNYPYNDLRDNPFVTTDINNYNDHNEEEGDDLVFTFSNRYTFHSPDTHFTEPGIGTELKFETVEYGESEGYFTKSKNQAKQRLLSNTSYALALTGGIVAAMLRTKEKECVEYTIRSNTQSISEVEGEMPFGDTSGTLTMGSGTITTSPGSAGWSGEGEGTTFWNDPYDMDSSIWSNNQYDEDGLPNISATNIDGENTKVFEYKHKTCKGTREQYFNNPSLNNNPAGNILSALDGIFGFLSKTIDFIRVVLEEMKIILDLIESLTPYRDWTIQYNSIGKYNNYKSVENIGDKRRSIIASSYLKSENAIINEEVDVFGNFDSIKFNNWNRESSVYLKYGGDSIPNASVLSGVTDESRITFEDGDVNETLDKKVYKNISSYYASIKNYVPDQYGSIYDIEYLSTDSCIFKIGTSNSDCRGVYGGDTFINRFSLKTKVPYFLATTFGLPTGTDFNYSEYPNLGFPRHYYNNTSTLGSEITNILDLINPLNILDPDEFFDMFGRPKSIRDGATSKFFYQNGYIYLYHYGIPYFFVESDINVDFRYAENMKEKAFYPVQSDLDFWLQEENIPINEDNYYFYNTDYSKQNKETPFVIDGTNFEPGRDCRENFPNRIIYATDNNWLTFKANDFFDVPLNKGLLTSVEGIENETVLIRTVNSMLVFKAFNLIPTDGETIQVGTGGVFKNKPQEFAWTPLGYNGSQHKAILHTEYGHISVDAKRGQVFNINLGAGGKALLRDNEWLDEISKDGLKNWFKENLPFRILRDFKNMPDEDIDNSFKGLGLLLAFDKRYNRFVLTKKDYKLKDKTIIYNSETKKFYKGEVEIKLGDKRYFEDVSWTVSYNFYTKGWVSHHSYKPNYYIDFVDFFASGNKDGLWLHGLTNSSYQVFYGKLYPFMVEHFSKFEGQLRILNNIEFDTEVRRYQSEYDYIVRSKLPGFNKVIIYNDTYNSGLLNMVRINKDNLTKVGIYPIKNFDNWYVEVTLANYIWRVNQFYNLVKSNSELPLWKYEGNNADKELNSLAFDYKKSDFDMSFLKGQWFKTRLINDDNSSNKIMSKFKIDNTSYSIK